MSPSLDTSVRSLDLSRDILASGLLYTISVSLFFTIVPVGGVPSTVAVFVIFPESNSSCVTLCSN